MINSVFVLFYWVKYNCWLNITEFQEADAVDVLRESIEAVQFLISFITERVK